MRVIAMPASHSIAVLSEYIREQFPSLPLAKETILSDITFQYENGAFKPRQFLLDKVLSVIVIIV